MYLQGASIDPTDQRRVLEAALAAARGAGGRGVVVFDLDSTLLDNRPRQARILREFAAARGIAQLGACRPEHITSWSLSEAMRNAGLPAAEVERVRHEARDFWRARFFTSEYCVDDIAIAGAVAFTLAVREAGARIAYVTGRHTAMGPGTVATFEREGFPLPDGEVVQLLLKPDEERSDDGWKIEAQARIEAIGELVAVFDNEPAHINGYAARYPGALCVRLATDDSGRPIPLAPSVVSVADFSR